MNRLLAKNDSFLVNDANPTIIHNTALITTNTSMTTSQYIRGTQSAYNLAMIFNANFEHPAVTYQPVRVDYANYWYTYFASGSHQSGEAT
ncbi:phage tail tip lysozyme [Lactobacillus sp. 3B(2020)]|uniref:phage tail tip lysozyme n=1 Tax=Lactobacillus sp. 3B(2020) TaxID=2695882 RepID=UPI0015DEB632|nr:phage tail tip lysozyme [Lactobacillus sp. 3B(2020)]QLL70767.1 hypothetical protein GTO83_09680 [Lactobacillus sp. 3B(2020)]